MEGIRDALKGPSLRVTKGRETEKGELAADTCKRLVQFKKPKETALSTLKLRFTCVYPPECRSPRRSILSLKCQLLPSSGEVSMSPGSWALNLRLPLSGQWFQSMKAVLHTRGMLLGLCGPRTGQLTPSWPLLGHEDLSPAWCLLLSTLSHFCLFYFRSLF